MNKKSFGANPTLSPDIELPLLSDKKYKPSFTSRAKSRFMEFFDPDTPSSKYIKKMSFLKFVTLSDMWPLVKLSNTRQKPLNMNDLPFPFSFCNLEQKIIAIDKEWTASLERNEPSIVRALLKAYKKEIFISIMIVFLVINGKWISSVLMGRIIKNISNDNLGVPIDYQETFLLTAMLGIIASCMVLCANWNWHYASLVSASMKNALVGYTYRKLQCVSLSSLQEASIGKVISLISTDVSDIERGYIYFIPMIWSPYTIMIGAILLWNFFGFATIFGILTLIGSLTISNHISKMTVAMKGQKKGITDERIKLTNELIESIRLIKMYAWEKPFKQAIESLRNNETIKLMKIRFIEGIGKGISDTSSLTSLIVICLVHVATGGVLSPYTVYTTLMILNFIGFWGVMFPHEGIMFISTFKVIKARFENLLLVKDISEFQEEMKRTSLNVTKGNSSFDDYSPSRQKVQVKFENFSAWWKKDDQKPCLSNINISLYQNQLITVIGSIGSGKTSFLLSLLREIPSTQGNLSINGTVAYVEQEPLIFSGTVRSNILFGLEYNDSLYKKVLRACNLSADLRQLEDGDKTIIGERGITLSGGQKARLSLARALYSQSDIYLLDDPLSAVDSKVGRHLFNYAIKGDLLRGKTVVLVTHHMSYAKESDRILLFSEGEIIVDGSYEETKMSGNNLFNKFKEIEDEAERKRESLARASTIRGGSVVSENNQIEGEDQHSKEGEINAEVTWSTYIRYIKESENYGSLVLLLTVSVIYSALALVLSRFMGYWGQAHSSFYFEKKHDETFNNIPYILIAIIINLTLILSCSFQIIITGSFLIQTNSNIHNKILKKIVQANVLFFDKTPIGVILNRFTNDLGVLDSSNATLLPLILDGSFYLAFRIISLLMVNPWIIILLIAVLVTLNKSKAFFKKAIIEVKRIDLTSRSPLYSEISATINGLLVIRTFRQGGTFIRKFCNLLYDSYRASIYADRTLRFFSILNMGIFESFTVIGTFACVFLAYQTDFEPGIFGLALVMLQEITTHGSWYLRTSLLVDVNMQSVERMFQLYEIDQEAPHYIPHKNASINKENQSRWVKNGNITFENVFMKYRPDFDYILKGLTFQIPGGSKIGVVGRTGAGKSSIIQALFRMTEIENIPGSSILIDGIDISKIGLNLLRNSISIIPQTPVVFSGTIRRNLDPFNMLTDNDLWNVLEEVNLKEHVAALEKKLDTDMTMSSSVFSAGQKQLICLARAILKESKIIVLDEATANVDIETDDFIQKKIMEKFRDSTVITIAHRLITIANYDKVIVMDKGSVVEYDSPYHLMVNSMGDQEITRKNGIFAQMVLNSGEIMAKKILKIAYLKQH